ncbi:hypothetical protein GCM10022407_35240 [Hymenobacter antarcticus]|uniref:Por secretion system C-terminal sorting domain-containing protein n=2 Tax=Hymenobacter antarcticus TaxID=486270 RepID=A0ABP7QSS6_9BACT
MHTLRLDSAYTTAAGDSAWAFNWLVRTSDGREQSINPYGIYRKSRNNLFGARLTWQHAPAAFILENLAEGSAQAAVVLQLRPQAAVGSTWAASTSPALTATLTSRTRQQVGTMLDSVAVITLSSGQVVRLSRTYGLLEAPQWLAATSTAPQWTQALLPMTLAQSAYNSTRLFSLLPGDEMGYLTQPFTISPFPAPESHTLRRILTRQQTADSLVFTFQEQTRTQHFGTPGGPPAGFQISPVWVRRWAFSLRTGKSLQFPALALLTGEYASISSVAFRVPMLVGRGLIMNAAGSGCIPSGLSVSFIGVFPGFNAPPGSFSTGIDIGWRQEFSVGLGLGEVATFDSQLVYYRRSVGTPLTCGSFAGFVNLLPTRAAQAAALATLHPNPAPDQATLTLAQPARAGHTLRLTDALGRTVWQAALPAGATTLAVPLAGQPAGLYLLHLSAPDGTAAAWKLNHE